MGITVRAFSLWASSLVLAAFASGQSLAEHAAATGGASAGAAAGKVVSDGLASLGGLLSGAAKTGEPPRELPPPVKAEKPAPKSKLAAKSPGSTDPMAGAIAVGSGIFLPQQHQVVYSHVRSGPAPVPVAAPVFVEPKQARVEDLQRIQPGMPESDVLAMGAFTSRITIPEDDGHLMQLLRYGSTTVHVVDGKVVSVGRN
jgi:hypothetical protein